MARAPTLSISGSDSLLKALDKLERAVRGQVLGDMLEEAAEPIRSAAEARAPRRTGRLASGITMERRDAKGRNHALVVVGPHKDQFYGTFQEFGWGPGPKQPFLRPAFDTRKDAAQKIAAVEMGKIVKRAVR